MSQHLTDELAIGYGLVALSKNLNTRGGWVQHQRTLIDSNLPFGDNRMQALVHLTDELATQYASQGRTMREAFFGYEQDYLLLLQEGPLRLGLLISKEHQLSDKLILQGIRFLQKNAPKICAEIEEHSLARVTDHSDSLWSAFELKLKEMMTKVLGSQRAHQFFSQAMSRITVPDNIDIHRAYKLAHKIIKEVPSKSERRLIREELQALFIYEGYDLS